MKAQSPESENTLAIRWVQAGVGAGLATCVVYPLVTMAPLPRVLLVVLASTLGPSLAVASLGLRQALRLHAESVVADLGALFNVLAGVLFEAMLLVQLSVRLRASGEAPAQQIAGVWLGLDVAWDVYIGLGTGCFAIAMLRHPNRQGHGIHRSRPRRRSAWIESHHLSHSSCGGGTSGHRSGDRALVPGCDDPHVALHVVAEGRGEGMAEARGRSVVWGVKAGNLPHDRRLTCLRITTRRWLLPTSSESADGSWPRGSRPRSGHRSRRGALRTRGGSLGSRSSACLASWPLVSCRPAVTACPRRATSARSLAR